MEEGGRNLTSHIEECLDGGGLPALRQACDFEFEHHGGVGHPHGVEARVGMGFAFERNADAHAGRDGLEHGLPAFDLQDPLHLDARLRESVLEQSACCRAYLAQNHALAFQLFNAHGLASRPWMAASNYQNDARSAVRDREESRILPHLGKDGDVGPERQEALQNLVTIANGDRKRHFRISLTERHHKLCRVGGPDGADAKLAHEEPRGRAEAFRGLGLEAEYPLRDREQAPAGIRQLDAMAIAAKQLDAEAILERLDVGGDARLADEKRARRSREASMLRDSLKAPQLVKVDFQSEIRGTDGAFPPGSAPGSFASYDISASNGINTTNQF